MRLNVFSACRIGQHELLKRAHLPIADRKLKSAPEVRRADHPRKNLHFARCGAYDASRTPGLTNQIVPALNSSTSSDLQ
jgi:hypothetical protein